MVYWHVERKQLCIYSQLTTCSASEVAAMLQGLLHHDTDAEIETNITDTHGASIVGFAFCELLGFRVMPTRPSTNSGAWPGRSSCATTSRRGGPPRGARGTAGHRALEQRHRLHLLRQGLRADRGRPRGPGDLDARDAPPPIVARARHTLIIQQILSEPQWAGRLTDRDRKALTALIWAHVNPYGTFHIDMNTHLDL